MKSLRAIFVLGVVIVALFFSSSNNVKAELTVVSSAAMLAAASVDETASTPVGPSFMAQARESAVYIEWGTGVVSGVVEVETARHSDYAGTWANLATVTFAGTAPNIDVVQVTGIMGAVRTRISTVVTGGTVSTWLTAN